MRAVILSICLVAALATADPNYGSKGGSYSSGVSAYGRPQIAPKPYVRPQIQAKPYVRPQVVVKPHNRPHVAARPYSRPQVAKKPIVSVGNPYQTRPFQRPGRVVRPYQSGGYVRPVRVGYAPSKTRYRRQSADALLPFGGRI